MTREEIEAAMIELDQLLEHDSNQESDYQAWFERHPLVHRALGYVRSIPHPSLITSAGQEFIPDFLVQRANGLWEIFELKTPQAAILRDRERRSTFYALFESYLAQCHEYAESLDQADTRALAQARYSIDLLQKRPQSVVVAGRSEGLDIEKVFTLAGRRSPPIAVYTFDDIRHALEQYRVFNFGRYESSRGLSIHTTILIHRSERAGENNHLFDVGPYENHDRIAAFVDPDGFLRLKVWDSNGNQIEAKSRGPLADEDYDRPLWLEFEVGVGDGFCFLAIQLEFGYLADIRISEFPFDLSFQYVLGSDWAGRGWSWFSVNEIVVYGRPLTFDEKLSMRRYALSRRKALYASNAGDLVVFRGNKFMQTKGHPLARSGGSHGAPTIAPPPGAGPTM